MREVLAEHGASIRRLCRGYERIGSLREELEQEILLQIWRGLERFRGDASLRTFVLRVAHNVAATHAGKEVRQPRGEDDGLALEAAGPCLENAAERRQQLARLEAAVRQLRVRDRQLVLLHLEGLSHAEIGAVTGESRTNISTRLSRLRAELSATVQGASR